MKRILFAVVAAALVISASGLTALQPVSAQPSDAPVCLNIPPGEYSFTAAARDRDGEVTFRVTIGDGGVVTEFIEPGGQSIPAAAMLQLFTGEEAYPLPDGVAIVECADSGDAGAMSMQSAEVCVNIEESQSGTVSAGGRTYEIMINVDDRHRVTSVELLGQSYTAQEAIGLLEGFGATMPEGVEIVDCAAMDQAHGDDSMMEDEGEMEMMEDDDGQTMGYPTSGSGGLADSSDRTVLWSAVASIVTLIIAVSAIAGRRRMVIRNRNRE